MAKFGRPALGLGTLAAILMAAAPLAAQALAKPSAYDEPPKVRKMTKPAYPKESFNKKIEGTVEIELVIDEQGRVTNPVVLKSVAGLDQAALDCVKQWKFWPAVKDGLPVKTTALAPVIFRFTDKVD